MAEALWRKGRTALVCSMYFHDERAKPRPVRSTSERPLVAAWQSSRFPVAERPCLDATFGGADCSKPHRYEQLWSLDIARALGKSVKDELSDFEEKKAHLLCYALYGATGNEVPDRYDLMSVRLHTDATGWQTCVFRHRD